jgi:hypothetical protein
LCRIQRNVCTIWSLLLIARFHMSCSFSSNPIFFISSCRLCALNAIKGNSRIRSPHAGDLYSFPINRILRCKTDQITQGRSIICSIPVIIVYYLIFIIMMLYLNKYWCLQVEIQVESLSCVADAIQDLKVNLTSWNIMIVSIVHKTMS